MKNKIVWGIIILAIIFSLYNMVTRYNIEKQNKNVELVMDDELFQEMKAENNLRDDYLVELKENGITGISVFSEDIEFLVNKGDLNFFKGEELEKSRKITGNINSIYNDFQFEKNSAFLITDNKKLKQRLKDNYSLWKKKYNEIEYREKDDKIVIFFPLWKEEYADFPVNNQNKIQKIEKAGLDVNLRVNNNKDFREYNRSLLEKYKPETVVFSGTEVLGYDSEKNSIDLTGNLIQKNNIKYGMIEPFIANQKGRKQLSEFINYNILRVHSLQVEEMEKYSLKKVVERYIRAVKERNVRYLYLKPFFEPKGEEDVLQYNLNYINKLKNGLEDNGLNVAKAETFPYFKNSFLFLVIVGAGIIISGLYLLEKLIGINLKKYFWILLGTGIILNIILLLLNKEILLRQILALGSAIVFPTLAVITIFNKNKKDNISKRWNIIIKFFKAILISLTGALFIISTLYHISFLYKVNQFRGVKLSFIMPLLLISLFYIRRYINNSSSSNIYEIITNFLNLNLKIKHILSGLIILIGGIFYIVRSGNYSLFSISVIEEQMRILLERWLIVRPRFKEFLIGHPFLIITLFWREKIKSNIIIYGIILLTAIGQISIVNTFSHIHIPLQIDFLRTFNGILLGSLIGIFLLSIIVLFHKGYLKLLKQLLVKYHE